MSQRAQRALFAQLDRGQAERGTWPERHRNAAVQNWQVQDIDGSSISDHATRQEAQDARDAIAEEYQRPFLVRRTV